MVFIELRNVQDSDALVLMGMRGDGEYGLKVCGFDEFRDTDEEWTSG